MSKDRVIVLTYDEPLLGIEGNEAAFKITAKEQLYAGGPLVPKQYNVVSTTRDLSSTVVNKIKKITIGLDNHD